MDPKNKTGNKQPKSTPSEKLAVLRNLRDIPHRLKSPDRLYNQDWFIGAVIDEHLEGDYMNEIAFSNRV